MPDGTAPVITKGAPYDTISEQGHKLEIFLNHGNLRYRMLRYNVTLSQLGLAATSQARFTVRGRRETGAKNPLECTNHQESASEARVEGAGAKGLCRASIPLVIKSPHETFRIVS